MCQIENALGAISFCKRAALRLFGWERSTSQPQPQQFARFWCTQALKQLQGPLPLMILFLLGEGGGEAKASYSPRGHSRHPPQNLLRTLLRFEAHVVVRPLRRAPSSQDVKRRPNMSKNSLIIAESPCKDAFLHISEHFLLSVPIWYPRDPPVLKMPRRVNFGTQINSLRRQQNATERAHKSLRKRGRKKVQMLKSGTH